MPAIRLSNDILGLRVVLGGDDGVYTLEIESIDFDWSRLTTEEKSTAVLDITPNVAELIKKLPEVTLVDQHE